VKDNNVNDNGNSIDLRGDERSGGRVEVVIEARR
jgi:hypothetical protein